MRLFRYDSVVPSERKLSPDFVVDCCQHDKAAHAPCLPSFDEAAWLNFPFWAQPDAALNNIRDKRETRHICEHYHSPLSG